MLNPPISVSQCPQAAPHPFKAAGLYEDFVKSFDGDRDSKTFVRGGAAPDDAVYRMDAKKGPGPAPPGPVGTFSAPSPSSSGGGGGGGFGGGAGAGKKQMSEMERLLEEMREREVGPNNLSRQLSFPIHVPCRPW